MDDLFEKLNADLDAALIADQKLDDLTDDEVQYLARVARVCQYSEAINGITFKIGTAKNRNNFRVIGDDAVINRAAWKEMGQDSRRELMRKLVCTIVDKKLHGEKAGKWELGYLIRQAERYM